MIKSIFLILILISFPFSYAEEGDEIFFDDDEIQEIIDTHRPGPEDTKQSPSLLQNLTELGHDKLDLSAIRDPKVLRLIEKSFDDSHLSLMSLGKRTKILDDQLGDSILKKYLDAVPKIKALFVDIVTDKKVIVGLLSILQKEDWALHIGITFVCVIFINFILDRIFLPHGLSFFPRLFLGLSINILSISSFFLAIYYIFYKELDPLVSMINSHITSWF